MINRAKNDNRLSGDPDLIVQALRRGFFQAVREHRYTGDSMVFWENGRVVEIPPDQLPDPDVDLPTALNGNTAAPKQAGGAADAVP